MNGGITNQATTGYLIKGNILDTIISHLQEHVSK